MLSAGVERSERAEVRFLCRSCDKISGQRFTFDCTPDFKQQLLDQLTAGESKNLINAFF